MASKRLDAMRAEVALIRSQIEALDAKAADENRDLTDEEKADSDALFARSEELAPEITAIVNREERLNANSDTLNRVGITPPAVNTAVTEVALARTQNRELKMSPGQFVAAVGQSWKDRTGESLDLLNRTLGLDGEGGTDIIGRTIATPTTITGSEGVIPEFIVGPLVQFVYNLRPTVNSMNSMPMPAKGKKFNRPRLVARNAVGVQASEFAEVSSNVLHVQDDEVTKVTLGGAVDLSEQEIDWSEPAFLDIVLNDLAEVYGVATEQYAASKIVAGITTNFANVSLTATSAQFQAALGTAASTIFGTAKQLPDTLYASPDRWGYLLGLTDTSGRPVFPHLGPQNAPGQLDATTFNGNPLGLNLVVAPAFPSGFMALGVSKFLEFYEMDKGQASIIQPGNLSVRFAYRGYVAANVYGQGLYGLLADTSASYHTSITP